VREDRLARGQAHIEQEGIPTLVKHLAGFRKTTEESMCTSITDHPLLSHLNSRECLVSSLRTEAKSRGLSVKKHGTSEFLVKNALALAIFEHTRSHPSSALPCNYEGPRPSVLDVVGTETLP
jgi:hypothetical protein